MQDDTILSYDDSTQLRGYVEYTIIAKNQYGVPLSTFEIDINGDDVLTDERGVYKDRIVAIPGASLLIKHNGRPIARFIIKSADNVFNLTYRDPNAVAPKLITITLLDYDGSPLPEMPFEIRQGGKIVVSAITDSDGEAQINADNLIGKKYVMHFEVTDEYRKNHQKAKK